MSAASHAPVKAAPVPKPAPKPALTPARGALLQRKCACGTSAQGKCETCNDGGKTLQRHAANHHTAPPSVPPVVHDVLRSSGRPLDRPTRSFMESRFGSDFSGVRVHDDARAAESARAVNARAYTVGQDIVFARESFEPHTSAGKALLAHELAHTIQQHGIQHAKENVSFAHSSEYDRLEHQADHAAHAALSGSAVRLTPAAGAGLSRAKDDKADEEGKIVSTKKKKSGNKQSNLGNHKVEPVEGFESEEGRIEEFEVDPFYLPAAKGPAAKTEYENIAGGKLETFLENIQITGKGRAKTALWQKREPTDELRARWLNKVGWTADSADDLWKRSGGGAEFPKLKNGTTCQMDHIVELQLGGDNTDQNIQPLERGPNQSSGGTIRAELESLAKDIATDSSMASEDLTEIKLRFKKVKVIGALDKLSASCPPPGKPSCLEVEKCATTLKVEKTETGAVKVASLDYPISAGGGSPRSLKVPVTFPTAKDEDVKIEGSPENNAASTLIPGMLLTNLRHEGKGKKAGDVVNARIDDRAETRLPISLNEKAGAIKLNVSDEGILTLDPALKKKASFAFTYKYLSPGAITSIALNESGGVDWEGYLKPSIPFLGRLDIAYKGGELRVTKGLDPKDLKRPFPGVQISQASIGLKLAPEFKPEGKLAFLFGPEAKPLAEAVLTASTDGVGFIADGTLRVFIPGVDQAEAKVIYKGGGDYGAGSWTGLITIESSQIKLPYVESGSLTVQLVPGRGIDVDGKVNLNLPGDNSATVGLKRADRAWIFSGGGRFKVPRVGPITVAVVYNTATEKLVAEAKDVSFEIFGVNAQLKSITGEIEPGKRPVFYGTGGVEIKKGKVDGRVDLNLNRDGMFTGKGAVSYQFNENLKAIAGVELDEKERLKFTGEIVLTYLKLFDAFGDKKDLFSLDIPIPIPGASIGGVGLEVRIGGGVTIGYNVGPGAIAPLKFATGFYPLEENPDLQLAVSGSVNIPASAFLEANIHADIVLDAFIAEVGGGVKLTGTIKLAGGFFAPFSATYKAGKIDGLLTPEIKFALILGLVLSIRAWAKAGIGWLSVKTEKTWDLARREIDTGLGFSLKAPIGYSTDTGPKLPSLNEIEFVPPVITTDKLKNILRELVSGADAKEREV